MKVELRNEKQLVITPENVAEQSALNKFSDGHVKSEKPEPFQPNVQPLIIEVKP